MQYDYELTEAVFTIEIDYAIASVHLYKIGGGTIGKKYAGHWAYMVVLDNSDKIYSGTDYHTGLPECHCEAANSIAQFIEAWEEE